MGVGWKDAQTGHIMNIYGKTSATAIAVMTYLAQHRDRRCGSPQIAQARGLSVPLTAKLLTQLATAGLVRGQSGPGGGYTLAENPEKISLLRIVSLFEQSESPSHCPFGPNWCGHGKPCPLHDELISLMQRNRAFLENTRLSVFSPANFSANSAV